MPREVPPPSTAPGVGRGLCAAATPDVLAAMGAPPRIDGLSLLVVDDEHDALAVMGEILRDYGAEVHVAASVAEALEKFATVRLGCHRERHRNADR